MCKKRRGKNNRETRPRRIRLPTRLEQTVTEDEQDQPITDGERPSLVKDESDEESPSLIATMKAVGESVYER